MDIPLNNITALKHDTINGWVSPPNVRGTMDILIVCISTILLCVYTAIHLNIPPPGEKQRYQFLRKVKWVTVAIIMPEIGLATAWNQLREARLLRNSLRKIRKEAVENADRDDAGHHSILDLPEERNLDLTYAFYVVMGGLRLRSSEKPELGDSTITVLERQGLALSSAAVIAFAREGVWWNIDHNTVQDKSKADYLAKILVVLQISWMVVQCVARSVAGLPLTLLELHTFIHAVCAAIMFALWFKKPFNIQEATIKTIGPDHGILVRRLLSESTLTAFSDKGFVPLTSRRSNFGVDQPLTALGLWKRIDEDLAFLLAPLVIDRISDDASAWAPRFNTSNACSLWAVQVLYGGLHLTAWDFVFVTYIESLLWKIACFVVMFALLTSIVGIFVLVILQGILEIILDKLPKFVEDVIVMGSLFCMLLLLLVWIAARTFIIVETLISLRSVPIGVYATVSWANYIPHI